jgi:hypothetical protein
MWGSSNVCLDVTFDDGVVWILKVSYYDGPSVPAEMARRSCRSEVATYRALHAGGVMVPEVYAWGVGQMSKPGSEFYIPTRADQCSSTITMDSI